MFPRITLGLLSKLLFYGFYGRQGIKLNLNFEGDQLEALRVIVTIDRFVEQLGMVKIFLVSHFRGDLNDPLVRFAKCFLRVM